jgi:hypothetical protein
MKELKRRRHGSSSRNDSINNDTCILKDADYDASSKKAMYDYKGKKRSNDSTSQTSGKIIVESNAIHTNTNISINGKNIKSNHRRIKLDTDIMNEESNRTKLSEEKTKSSREKQSCRYEISDIDHENVVRLLRLVEWNKIQNISRQNVIRKGDKNTPKNNSGKEYCHSFIFGKNMKDSEGKLSFWSTQCPELYELFQSLIRKVHPEHSYTNITVNKNLSCKRHTDGGNTGLSYIISFGHFTGGRLLIEDVGGGKARPVNIYRNFFAFEGSKQPHETEEFHGERYSAVFYTSSMQPTETTPRQRVSNNEEVDSEFKKKFDAIKKKLIKR